MIQEGGEQDMDVMEIMDNIDLSELVESTTAEDSAPVNVSDIVMEKIHQYPRF